MVVKNFDDYPDQAMKLVFARGHLNYLESMISQTEVELYVRIKPYYELVEYIAAMPGITELSATIILAGAYLKPLMVQCALAAIKSKKQPYFYNKIWKNQETKWSQKSNYRHSTYDDGLHLSHRF